MRTRPHQLLVTASLALGLLASGCTLTRNLGATARYAGHLFFTGEGRQERLEHAAYRAYHKGNYPRAAKLYARIRERRPAEPAWALAHARALARMGRTDELFGALSEAARLGHEQAWQLEEEPAFDAVEGEPRFQTVLQRVRDSERAHRDRSREASVVPPASEAPSFPSLKELEAANERGQKAIQKTGSKQPYAEQWLLEKRFEARYVVALSRYVADHPTTLDRETALLALVRGWAALAQSSGWRVWRTDHAAGVREAAVAYLAAYPDSPARSEVALYRALAGVKGTVDPNHDWAGEEPPAWRCAEGIDELETLSANASADPWARRALGYKALCESELHREPDQVRKTYEAYQALEEAAGGDKHSLDYYLRSTIAALAILTEGPPPFTARTLAGDEVSLAKLRGRWVLLDFWGPG